MSKRLFGHSHTLSASDSESLLDESESEAEESDSEDDSRFLLCTSALWPVTLGRYTLSKPSRLGPSNGRVGVNEARPQPCRAFDDFFFDFFFGFFLSLSSARLWLASSDFCADTTIAGVGCLSASHFTKDSQFIAVAVEVTRQGVTPSVIQAAHAHAPREGNRPPTALAHTFVVSPTKQSWAMLISATTKSQRVWHDAYVRPFIRRPPPSFAPIARLLPPPGHTR